MTFADLANDAADYCKEMDCKFGTLWTAAFTFNAIMLILMALNFALMTIGAFYFYPRLIGTFLNCCYGCCHFAAWVLTLAVRFNPPGRYCAINIASNQYEGNLRWTPDSWTYKKDG